MTKTGTYLSRALYYVVWAMTALVGVLALAVIGSIVWTWFNPQVLWDAPLIANYGDVRLAWPNTAAARYGLCGIGLALCGLMAMVLVPLLGIMRSTGRGLPFVAANVARLRIIAAAFALVALLQVMLPLLSPMLRSILGAETVRISAGPVFAAIVVLVLAEVFAEGVRMREEAEGTI